jgi:hypothetical protein
VIWFTLPTYIYIYNIDKKIREGLKVEKNKEIVPKNNLYEDENSLKGALFSSIVFVGGTIVAVILLLIVFYMIRI